MNSKTKPIWQFSLNKLAGSLLFFTLFTPLPARADMQPEQVAVIANISSHESTNLAAQYAELRKIPRSHLLKVDLPTDENIDRKTYEQKLAEPLRRQLSKLGLAAKVRVLITTYGIPLHVAAPEENEEDRSVLLQARAKQDAARAALLKMIEQAELLPSTNPSSKEKAAPPSTITDQDLLRFANQTLKSAAGRIKEQEDKELQKKGAQFLTRLVLVFGGINALAADMQRAQTKDNAQTEKILQLLTKEIAAGQKLLQGIEEVAPVRHQQQAYLITSRLFGAAGVLSLAQQEIETRTSKDADASVDSELSLLWWERGFYPLSGRISNPYYQALAMPAGSIPPGMPVMMVSRLDAPSYELAQKLALNAVEAEKTGLEGKVYIDARGLKPSKLNDALALWDDELVDFGSMMRRLTSYPVYIDRLDSLIDKAPDAAIYAGWYSLRNYHDVFTYVPGAIGYHIASLEAVSIHQSEEKGWCKNMLSRGITATLGAVAEPYVEAFPNPRDFFGLMLTGEYSLVEAYYLASPSVSWRMVLFGDPFYNPWRNRAPIKLEDAGIVRNGKRITSITFAPLMLNTADPAALRAKIEEQRKVLRQQIADFFKKMNKQPAPAK